MMALALCQSEGPKPEEATKTLAKAVDIAGAAGLLDLKVSIECAAVVGLAATVLSA